MLGCSKTDISRWRKNPLSTHAVLRKHKLAVIARAAELFEMTESMAESLANSAGLSLCRGENPLKKILGGCSKAQRKNLYYTVSERMLQYYMAGKVPTKQALMAIAIILEYSTEDIEGLLREYGYCLSPSLISDAVVQWYLCSSSKSGIGLLNIINEKLEELELPLLMTK